MKRLKFAGGLAAFVLAAGVPAAAFAGAGDAIGTWKDMETGGTTQVYNCGQGICAKIVAAPKGKELDAKNPNAALQRRPLAGVVIMSSAVQDGANRWKGKLYNPEDGETYSGSLEVRSKDELKLQGCVLGFLCKSHTWRRTQ